MFESRTELKEQLAAANADAERLEAELAAALALNDEAAVNAQLLAEVQEDLAAARDALTAEENAHAATREALAAEQAKTTDEAINALVVAKLAEAGHPPIEFNAEPGKTESKHEQYRKLQESDPHAAAKFWDEHKDAILASY